MKSLLLALLALLPLAAPAEEPAEYRTRIPLETGSAPLQSLVLPAAAYDGLQRADLGDLRVFNGAGEPVPIARVESGPPETRTLRQAVPLFPLPEAAGGNGDDARIRIERRADGTLVSVETSAPRRRNAPPGAYVADLSAWRRPVGAIELSWRGSPQVSGKLQVEASDDLTGWRAVTGPQPVLSLTRAGQRVERRRIPLASVKAEYLRLTWTESPAPVVLDTLTVEYDQAAADAPREWRTLEGREDDPGDYRFASPGLYPADRLRVHLPQPNTVVPVSAYSRARPSDPWTLRAKAVAYRLAGPDGDTVNPDLVLPGVRDPLWRLQVDQKGGGAGAGTLRIELGWHPERIIFAARGEGPFLLAVGNAAAPSAFYPVTTLVPEADAARIAALPAARALPGAPDPTAARAAARTREQGGDDTRWVLWAVLVAGVGLLGWMARALWRQMGS